jgi:hypothetical protein
MSKLQFILLGNKMMIIQLKNSKKFNFLQLEHKSTNNQYNVSRIFAVSYKLKYLENIYLPQIVTDWLCAWCSRFSWFIPTAVVSKYKSALMNQPSPDHWRVFTRPDWMSMYNLDIGQFAKYAKEGEVSNDYYCQDDYCVDGVHTPQQCQQNAKCAILLASYPGA